ncbi:hypothetical protein P691DRAFT_807910 [Macrolepiota fuliginosa MF-IS2]|uniref:Uncharacterized protein n=1 Tax=Macrolepiota fuliginosa MF-IS2 TaxID=1400762 RepID=A0A9P6BYC2_9AGAR|nr:hypothetical protein P691DRAFT_807910 [Macrolepiota fuliginosa MF-IS2]
MHRFSDTAEGLARRAGVQLDAKSDGEPLLDSCCDSLIPLSPPVATAVFALICT